MADAGPGYDARLAVRSIEYTVEADHVIDADAVRAASRLAGGKSARDGFRLGEPHDRQNKPPVPSARMKNCRGHIFGDNAMRGCITSRPVAQGSNQAVPATP